MSLNLVRYRHHGETSWGVVDGPRLVALPGTYGSTAEVLSAAAADARAVLDAGTGPAVLLEDVEVLNPVPSSRVFCLGANYRSHMVESGMDPDRAFNMIFTKSTASMTGPNGDIVRPGHVRLLDYEVELGVVLGRAIGSEATITDETLPDYVGAFVLANDVSARDVQLPQGQWYKGKSYATFCPVGPYLCIPDPDEIPRWRDLRLRLSVNGEPRQESLAGDMVFGPAESLSELSQIEHLEVGDLLLTGTPGGVALQPPKAVVQRISGLLPEAKRWELFVKTQARSSAYLKPGDEVTASICTDDGALDLGAQNNRVR